MTITKIFPFGGSAPRIEQDELDRDIVGGKGLGLVSFVIVGYLFWWICGLTSLVPISAYNCSFHSDLSSLIMLHVPLSYSLQHNMFLT